MVDHLSHEAPENTLSEDYQKRAEFRRMMIRKMFQRRKAMQESLNESDQ